MMNENALRYPVLSFSPTDADVMCIHDNIEQLTSCNRFAIKRGEFAGKLLVDATGQVYRTRGVRSCKRTGRFFGFELSLFDQPWKVELDIEDASLEVSVDEIRDRMLTALIEGRYSWEQVLEPPGIPYEEVIRQIKAAESLPELVKLLDAAMSD